MTALHLGTTAAGERFELPLETLTTTHGGMR